jgi:hypothetical protein
MYGGDLGGGIDWQAVLNQINGSNAEGGNGPPEGSTPPPRTSLADGPPDTAPADPAQAPPDFMSILSKLLGTGGGGAIGPLGMLAGLLGPAFGAVLAHNSTKTATNQTLQGITNAQNALNTILGGSTGYQPYMQSGATALGKLNSMQFQPSNMSVPGAGGANFGPVPGGNAAFGPVSGFQTNYAPLSGKPR